MRGRVTTLSRSTAAAKERSPAFSVIKPEILGGEQILVVQDPEALVEGLHPDLVAYVPRELRELERLRDHRDLIRAAHVIKKHLGASVIPHDSPLGRSSRGCVAIPAERFLGTEKESDSVD